jgi:16S rRNA (cytosine1402-N4)-methyltransferase
MFHAPVLCEEAVALLKISAGGTYLDATVGGGGHAEKILMSLAGRGRLFCCDRDNEALEEARRRLLPFRESVEFLHAPFDAAPGKLRALGVTQVDGVLMDLGISSHQLDEERRGFSFRGDAPLDMRMDAAQDLSAWHVVNTYEEQRLADVLWRYGEERHSRRIARRIVQKRPVETTGGLREVVASGVAGPHLVKTLARVFQAIRIEVNGELDRLTRFLEDLPDFLAPGGRLVVIAYHSLEDRIVKDFMRREAAVLPPRALLPGAGTPGRLVLVTKKPLVPSDAEIGANPRARSAKLRAAERSRADE